MVFVAHLQFAQTNSTKPKLQKSHQANARQKPTLNDLQTDNKIRRAAHNSRFGVMAGAVPRMTLLW